jgi:hypothetical protein
MNFVKDLDGIQESHSELFSDVARADPRFSSNCLFLVSRLRGLADDIREHAAHGSGPRQKEWQVIIRKILAIADDVSHIQRNGPSAIMATGFREYADVRAMIQDLGEF